MSKTKKKIITFLFGVVILFVCIVSCKDLYNILQYPAITPSNQSPIQLLKLLVPFSVFGTVIITGKDAHNRNDLIRLFFIFLVLLAGDIFILFFNMSKTGFSLFLFSHVLLFHRNSYGVRSYLRRFFNARDLLYILPVSIVSIFIPVYLLKTVFAQVLQQNPLHDYIVSYVVFISISLYIALLTVKSRCFPMKNALLIISNMLLFYASSILVAYRLVLVDQQKQMIALVLTWFFYGMSLFPLGLSGYSFRK